MLKRPCATEFLDLRVCARNVEQDLQKLHIGAQNTVEPATGAHISFRVLRMLATVGGTSCILGYILGLFWGCNGDRRENGN